MLAAPVVSKEAHYAFGRPAYGNPPKRFLELLLELPRWSVLAVLWMAGVAFLANGWEDGRFGPTRLFLENPNLAGWAGHRERLAYYRGHHDGRRMREMLAPRDSA